jgi:glycosyltransferase involved in cell wall biosynthesis
MNTANVDLSIVIPLHDEAENLPALTARLDEVMEAAPFSYEVLFVDDGSHDATWPMLVAEHARQPRHKALRLRRNMGKAAAYMAGFARVSGTQVATMDGDMQDDPADLLRLREALGGEYDMAIGWKQSGKSSRSTFHLSRLFNGLIRWVAGVKFHDINCPLRVMSREVADAIDIYASLHRYIPILATSDGYRVTEVTVTNRARLHGRSRYGYRKYFESLFDIMTVLFVTRFRRRPLQLLGPIGLASLLLGLGIDFYYMMLGLTGIDKMRNNIPSLLLGISLIMIGIQIILTGLLGEMISRELHADRKVALQMVGETVGLDHA